MLDNVANLTRSPNLPVALSAPTPASVLIAILRLLEESGVPYVVLHGYEKFPDISGSDIDICIDRSINDRWIRQLLEKNAGVIGAQVVSCHNGAVLLAGKSEQQQLFFIKLDLEQDYALNGLRILPGNEILAARRWHKTFHVPSLPHQLAGYLATSLLKQKLDIARARRLTGIYRSDPVESIKAIGRLWSDSDQALILRALAEDQWGSLFADMPRLRNNLITRLHQTNLTGRGANLFRTFKDRVTRLIKPMGMSVVVLGPDGAGKSSITDAVGGPNLMPIFNRSVCWGFVPPLHRLIGRNEGPSNQPHALRARSRFGSLIKAGYWLAFSLVSHPRTILMKARGGLVLYDRHFVDILVDATRYRYSGPLWVLRAIWALIPKPDLVVLLDAPAEHIQKRKMELTVEETERQLLAYRKLVASLPNGVIIDANKSFSDVVEELNQLLLNRYLKRQTEA